MKRILVVVFLVALAGTVISTIPAQNDARRIPLSLQLKALSVIPGYWRFMEWNARWTASTDSRAGHSVLLAAGMDGTGIMVEGCWVASYDRDRSIESPLPWLPGKAAPAVVHCNRTATLPVTDVTIIEVGCIASDFNTVFARAYNETILELHKARAGTNV